MARAFRILAALIALIGFGWSQAHAQVPMTGAGRGSPVSAATTFDLANKSANITLSGVNLVSTTGVGGGAGTNVRDTVSHTTGKFYAEFTVTTAGASPPIVVGLINGSFAVGTDIVGITANGIGFFASDGHVYMNNISQLTGLTYGQGDVVNIAVDLGAKLFWVRKNGAGFWNFDATPADPATGVGGVSFAAMGSGPFYLAVEQETNGEVITANFGPSFLTTPPSGYGSY